MAKFSQNKENNSSICHSLSNPPPTQTSYSCSTSLHSILQNLLKPNRHIYTNLMHVGVCSQDMLITLVHPPCFYISKRWTAHVAAQSTCFHGRVGHQWNRESPGRLPLKDLWNSVSYALTLENLTFRSAISNNDRHNNILFLQVLRGYSLLHTLVPLNSLELGFLWLITVSFQRLFCDFTND